MIAGNIGIQRAEKMRSLLFLAVCKGEVPVDNSRGWLVEAMLLNMVNNGRAGNNLVRQDKSNDFNRDIPQNHLPAPAEVTY